MTALTEVSRFLGRFLLVLLASLLLLNFVLAGAFSYLLTHPACPLPQPLPGVPDPELHTFFTEDGHELEVWYYPAKNGAAIVALGGLGGSLGGNLPRVDFLYEAGYGLLQIESRACADPPAAVTLGWREAQDAVLALEFLLTRPEVDEDRIALFGFSMGAAAAIRAAALEPRFAAIVAEDSYFNLGEHWLAAGEDSPALVKLPLYTSLAFLFPMMAAYPFELSPGDAVSQLSPRPLFLVYSEGSAESGNASDMFSAAGESAELWVVPGSLHGNVHQVAGAEYDQRVLAFYQSALRAE